MTHLPVSRELQPLMKSRSAASPQTALSRVTGAFNGPDVLIVTALCLLGVLLMLNFMFRYPEIGELIQQYNLF